MLDFKTDNYLIDKLMSDVNFTDRNKCISVILKISCIINSYFGMLTLLRTIHCFLSINYIPSFESLLVEIEDDLSRLSKLASTGNFRFEESELINLIASFCKVVKLEIPSGMDAFYDDTRDGRDVTAPYYPDSLKNK